MRFLMPLALAAALAACSPAEAPPSGAAKPAARSGGAQADCTSRAYPEIGGPISLIDHTGKRVTEADFQGRPALVYFGFTYCPDVCPMALTTLAAAYRKLPEGKTIPQTLLISVDPERDTPEALATYVSSKAFPEGLVGLTGTDAEIRAAADAFKADYSRIEQPESLSEYTMDHTSLIYVMDGDWKIRSFFTHADTADTISECLGKLF
ncbi:SCO family protein [Hyphomonas sp.]|uniref:SCO family protein n=1 Tax=Hyphomonas sp. TaxID=87 RepID=UPI00391A9B96